MIPQRSFACYLLFSLLTCGIYSIVFFCKWTAENNHLCAGDGQKSPPFLLVLLFSLLTFGVYYLYWCHHMADRLQMNAPRYQIQLKSDGNTVLLWMTLGFFFLCGIGHFVGLYLLVCSQNKIAEAYNHYIQTLNITPKEEDGTVM